jgi:hypothetical protein
MKLGLQKVKTYLITNYLDQSIYIYIYITYQEPMLNHAMVFAIHNILGKNA